MPRPASFCTDGHGDFPRKSGDESGALTSVGLTNKSSGFHCYWGNHGKQTEEWVWKAWGRSKTTTLLCWSQSGSDEVGLENANESYCLRAKTDPFPRSHRVWSGSILKQWHFISMLHHFEQCRCEGTWSERRESCAGLAETGLPPGLSAAAVGRALEPPSRPV